MADRVEGSWSEPIRTEQHALSSGRDNGVDNTQIRGDASLSGSVTKATDAAAEENEAVDIVVGGDAPAGVTTGTAKTDFTVICAFLVDAVCRQR